MNTLQELRSAFVAALLLAGAATSQDVTRTIEFEPMAIQFIADQELDPEALGSVLWSEVMNTPGFCFVQAGAFDIRIPSTYMSDRAHARSIKTAVLALLRCQRSWMAWYLRDEEGYEQARADLSTLEKWAGGWSPGAMKKAAERGGNLVELIKPTADLTAATGRFRSFAGPTEDQLFELGEDVGTILLAPTRKFFLETLAFLGWIDLERRDFYWADNSVAVTAAWYDWTHIVPLEGAAWPVDLEQPFKGQSHNEHHKSGLRQFVVDRGCASLLRSTFFRTEYSVFESALRTNLVIETCGANDLYLADWGLSFGRSGASRQGTSRFVPSTGLPTHGGQPLGRPRGNMRINAKQVPRWRRDAGADNFKEALARAQKKGVRLAAKRKDTLGWKDRLAHFPLDSAKSSEKDLATAPFFGEAALRKAPPRAAHKNDFEEFARAYRSAFFHWMRTEGKGKESAATFRKLMSSHADPFGEVTFADMVQEAYGLPLSGDDGSTDSMEWRFLEWLSK